MEKILVEVTIGLNLYDLSGKLVRQIGVNESIIQLDRGALSAGVYIYQVVGEESVLASGKLVVE